jgi:hypothetical protein
VEAEQPVPAGSDRDRIRRRRRWLYAFAMLAVLAIGVAVALSLLNDSDKKDAAKRAGAPPPVVLERFELRPVGSQRGRGLGELVRRPKNDGLRVLAVGIRPTLETEVYQLVLAGGRSRPKLLGNEKVDENKTFIGEAKITANDLHSYSRIELRRVTQGDPPVDKLVLRGKIPN